MAIREKMTACTLLALTLVTMAESHPVTPDTDETSAVPPVETSAVPPVETVSSHLLFYLTVEKELVPQTKDLAARALHILQIKCGEFYNKTSECVKEADQLPEISALGDFPSPGALDREGSKVFSKHLLKDVHRTLLKLQVLLEEENEGIEPLTQLIATMDRTRRNLRHQLDLFYKPRLRDRDSFSALSKSKRRFMRRSRHGSHADCRRDDEDDDCFTEDDYRLRLLYTAYRQLLRVHHVLGYTVRLSWLALEEDTWP